MADRPAVPYERPPKCLAEKQDIAWRDRCRKLRESGHVKTPAKRIPLYRMKPEPPEVVA